MHVMAVHVPQMIRRHGNIKQFSCQGENIALPYDNTSHNLTGVEKLNDVAKHSYFSSCKWDPTEEIMLTEQRILANSLLSRKRRMYTKNDTAYWSEGIKLCRKKQRKH